MLKKISIVVLSLFLMIIMVPTMVNEVDASGYIQLDKSSNIKSGFEFANGVNTDIDVSKSAMFVKCSNESNLSRNTCTVDTTYNNGVVNNAKRPTYRSTPVYVWIKDGFKYLDGSTYDIYMKITVDKDLASNSIWIAKRVDSGKAHCIEVSPFNMAAWANDAYVGFDYQIWLRDANGNDPVKTKGIDLTAGSCWTAVNEGARPYGDDKTIYTNIPTNKLAWQETITANGKTYNVHSWHITDNSYNRLNYYILGNGTNADGSILGGYVRTTAQGGSAEMMLGYFLSFSGNDYVGFYDGKAHGITVNVEGSGKVEYSLDKNNWSSTNPTFSNVCGIDTNDNCSTDSKGNTYYTVYYKVSGEGHKDDIKSGTVTIKKRPITITPSAHDKVYDGTTNATIDDVKNYSTGINSESINITDIKGAFVDSEVGTNKVVNIDSYQITYNNKTLEGNYDIQVNNPKASISKADIIGVNATPYQGVYDGEYHNITVNNVPSDASIKYYSDKECTKELANDGYKDVGTYTVYYKVTSSNTNYNELSGSSLVNITKKTVYLTPSAESRMYKKGDVSANVNDISATLTGVKDETVSVSGLSGNFESDEVGNNKLVKVDYSKATYKFSNDDAYNYDVVINDTNANIYKASINDIKVTPYIGYYDGEYHNIKVEGDYIETVTYYAGDCDLDNLSENDSCKIIDSKGYINANEYTVYYKVMDINGNYKNATGKSTVTIKKLPLEFTPTAESRVYEEGNTSATVKDIENVSTGVKEETITIAGIKGTFLDVNNNPTDQVGDNRTVLVEKGDNYNVSGTNGFNSDNYEITVNDTNASITEASVNNLTVKPYKGIYDGNGHNISVSSPTTGSITYYVGDACNIDTLEGCNELKEENYYKNVGTYKVYYVFEDINTNYQNAKGYSTVTITKRDVYVSPVALNKEYDGNIDATVNDVLDLSTGVKDETVSITGLKGTFKDPNVGNNKEVSVDYSNVSYSFSNNDEDNYNVIINDTTASIFEKDQNNITVKPYVGYYDGKTHNIEVDSKFAKSIKYYSDGKHEHEITGYKDVCINDGSVCTYTVYYVIEDVNENYRNKEGSSTVEIKPLPITVTPSANNKVYDGNTDAVVNDINNFKTGIDDESINVTGLKGQFDNANAGDGKIVTITNKDTANKAANENTKLSNYQITINDTTAKITKASLSGITSAPYNGVYDGDNHNIEVNVGTLENTKITYYSDEDLTSELSEDYKNAGTYTVYFKVESDDNHNPFTGNNTVTILKKDVEINTKGIDRYYVEGDVDCDIEDLSNIKTTVKDEAITSIKGLVGTFDDDSVGNNKYVRVYTSDAKVEYKEDTLEDNYNLIYLDTTASILAKQIEGVNVKAYSGYYDGKTHNIEVTGDYVGEVKYYSDENHTKEIKGYKDVCLDDNSVCTYTVYFVAEDKNNNYTPYEGYSTVKIKPLPIVLPTSANDKVYDGNTSATVNDIVGYKTGINDESINVYNIKGEFIDPNVGEDIPVVITNRDTLNIVANGSTNLNNYTITIDDTSANISKANLEGIISKPYEGVYDGKYHNITVDLGLIKNANITYYSDKDMTTKLTDGYKNAGTYTVYFKVSVSDNYYEFIGSNTVTIKKKDVDIYPVGTNRVYKENDLNCDIKDISNKQTGVGSESITSISGLIGTFDSDIAENDKHVSIDSSKVRVKFASGTLESNYNLIYHDTTASITKKETTDYDVQPYVGTYDGKIHNIYVDSKYADKIEYFADEAMTKPIDGYIDVKHDSNGEVAKYDVYYKITDTNTSYTGATGKSYVLIYPVEVSVNLTANDKVYDGTSEVSINNDSPYSTNVNNETFTLNISNERFEDENVGTSKSILIDYSINGTGSFKNSNYKITVNTPNASITPIDISVSVGTYYKKEHTSDPNFELDIKGDIVSKDLDDFNDEVKAYITGDHDEVGIYIVDISEYSNKFNNYNITYNPGKLLVYENNNKFFKNVTDTSNKFIDADMANSLEDLLNNSNIVSEKEKEASYGVIWLEISDSDESNLPTTIVSEIKKLATKLVGNNPKIVYFDAMMYKYINLDVNNEYTSEIHDTGDKPITITVKIPDELINSNSSMIRSYKIIRYHEDDQSVIELDVKYDETSQTITFESNKFSTFALAYKDTPKDNNNGGGTKSEENTPCEEWNHSKNWTWSEKEGRCVYKVDNTNSR